MFLYGAAGEMNLFYPVDRLDLVNNGMESQTAAINAMFSVGLHFSPLC
jgi:hypothetical protein